MDWFFYITLFLLACGILHRAGEQIIRGLDRITQTLGVNKFIVSFFVMALAASLPNLVIGITSATQGVPELSLGDTMGNNIIALAVGVSLATLFSRSKKIPTNNPTIQGTSIFTFLAAILPLLLLGDGVLSRGDGVVLLLFFKIYIFWLFSKKEHFVDEHHPMNLRALGKNIRRAVFDVLRILIGVILLVLSAQGIVWSVTFIAESADLPIVFIGVVLVGLASALPEVYFAVRSAQRGESSMILGNIMGSVIIPATFVLGIIAILHPIVIENFALVNISRLFLGAIALCFLVFARSGRSINEREALILFTLYIFFVISLFSLETDTSLAVETLQLE